MHCFTCNAFRPIPNWVVSYRCRICNQIQCLQCLSSHDQKCDVKPILVTSAAPNQIPVTSNLISTVNQDPVKHPAGNLPLGLYKRLSLSKEPVKSRPNNNKKVRSLSVVTFTKNDIQDKPMIKRRKTITGSSGETADRIYCEACGSGYARKYWNKHQLTKKHRENIEHGRRSFDEI